MEFGIKWSALVSVQKGLVTSAPQEGILRRPSCKGVLPLDSSMCWGPGTPIDQGPAWRIVATISGHASGESVMSFIYI